MTQQRITITDGNYRRSLSPDPKAYDKDAYERIMKVKKFDSLNHFLKVLNNK